jgi:hypothetical protein
VAPTSGKGRRSASSRKDYIARTFIQQRNNTQLPNYGRNQFGLNLRGPIARGKLYFAGSYEGTTTDNYIDVVPTTTAAAWNQYRGSFLAPQKNHTFFTRLTATPNKSTYDFMWSTRILDGEGNFGGRSSRDAGISQEYLINTAQLRHRWLPATNLVNSSRSSTCRDHTEAPLFPGPTHLSRHHHGDIRLPARAEQKHFRLVNRSTYNLDNFKGNHLIKFGVELAKIDGSQYPPSNSFGSFSFLTDTSTLPNAASISVGFTDPAGTEDARAKATGYSTGFYVNDEWRPVDNLTVNVGLRYDAELNTLNNDYTVPWASDTRLTSRTELNDYINRGDRKNDLNNFSPRISFSWDPNRKNQTFLRGGYAILFDRVTSFIGFQERLNSTWRSYTFANPGTTDPNVLRQRVAAGGATAPLSPVMVKNLMQTPENRQFSLGVGHQLTDAFGINVDYVRQDIRNLYVRLNANWFNRTTNARVLSPAYGDIILWDDFGKAKFDGLVTQATYSKNGQRLNLAYTLGWYKSEFDGNRRPSSPTAPRTRCSTRPATSGIASSCRTSTGSRSACSCRPSPPSPRRARSSGSSGVTRTTTTSPLMTGRTGCACSVRRARGRTGTRRSTCASSAR